MASAPTPVRLIVLSFSDRDLHELNYRWIKEDDIDEVIEGYLAQLENLTIEDGGYDPPVDKDARVFIGYSNKRGPDCVATEKKAFVHHGLPKNASITKVYSIVETAY